MNKKFTNDFILCLLTTMLGTLLGWMFSPKDVREAVFIIFGMSVIIIFLFFYFRNYQQIGSIDNTLGIINETMKGRNCVFFDDREEYYKKATELVANAKFEILTFNDYFVAENPTLGTNTPAYYYKALEDKLQAEQKNSNFKHTTIYHLSQVGKSNLSPNLTAHLKKINDIQAQFKGKLAPVKLTKSRYQIHLSFTIIDRKYLRITFHGIPSESKLQTNTSGGLIFYENNEGIVNELEKWYTIIEKNSQTVDTIALLE